MQRDVFICHASEDKEAVVRPLAIAFANAGVTCWLDEAEILWGDSIVEKVNGGLRQSRFVVVVLSASFVAKPWPQRELYCALGMEAGSGDVLILPLLVGSRKKRQQIIDLYPLLNDKLHMVWHGSPDEVVQGLMRRLAFSPRIAADSASSAAAARRKTKRSTGVLLLLLASVLVLVAAAIPTGKRLLNIKVPVDMASREHAPPPASLPPIEEALDYNVALGKPVTVKVFGNDADPGAGGNPQVITDGKVNYSERVESRRSNGVIGWVNRKDGHAMTVEATITLQGLYEISEIRYTMGDVSRASSWSPDEMITPFGSAKVNPGTEYKKAWTRQVGKRTVSKVLIQFVKMKRSWDTDWLFIGEIEVYGHRHYAKKQ